MSTHVVKNTDGSLTIEIYDDNFNEKEVEHDLEWLSEGVAYLKFYRCSEIRIDLITKQIKKMAKGKIKIEIR